ncbi:MAG TPA: hypothetical protein VK145_00490, partial [Candidatus Nanoarchaeia archaeon]|nr:hypothetical protein [Candidatus Nanoarchaeia archaeon]
WREKGKAWTSVQMRMHEEQRLVKLADACMLAFWLQHYCRMAAQQRIFVRLYHFERFAEIRRESTYFNILHLFKFLLTKDNSTS